MLLFPEGGLTDEILEHRLLECILGFWRLFEIEHTDPPYRVSVLLNNLFYVNF
jgi:hypothetical protein